MGVTPRGFESHSCQFFCLAFFLSFLFIFSLHFLLALASAVPTRFSAPLELPKVTSEGFTISTKFLVPGAAEQRPMQRPAGIAPLLAGGRAMRIAAWRAWSDCKKQDDLGHSCRQNVRIVLFSHIFSANHKRTRGRFSSAPVCYSKLRHPCSHDNFSEGMRKLWRGKWEITARAHSVLYFDMSWP